MLKERTKLKTIKLHQITTDQNGTKHDGSGRPRKISLWWARNGGAVSAGISGASTTGAGWVDFRSCCFVIFKVKIGRQSGGGFCFEDGSHVNGGSETEQPRLYKEMKALICMAIEVIGIINETRRSNTTKV